MFFPVDNEILNVANLHSLFLSQTEQIILSCHGAIFIHDFTAESHRMKSSQTAQIHGGFRMARTFKDSPFLCPEREHMSWFSELIRANIRTDCRHCRHGTFKSRNTGSCIFEINGFQKGGLVIIRIVPDHRCQAQTVRFFSGHRHADNSLSLRRHAIQIFRCGKFRSADIVPFIFTGFCVLHNDASAFFQFFNNFFNGIIFIFHNILL